MENKKCPCGLSFYTDFSSKVYCSRRCAKKMQKKRASLKLKSIDILSRKTCSNCNITFETLYNQKKYCSKKCRESTHKKNKFSLALSRKKFCILCGNSDDVKLKFCSKCVVNGAYTINKKSESRLNKKCIYCSNESKLFRKQCKNCYVKMQLSYNSSSWYRNYREYILEEWYKADIPCAICSNSSCNLTVDHIVPISKGGLLLDKDNMQPLCLECNSNKSDFLIKTNFKQPEHIKQFEEPQIDQLFK